MGRIKKAAGPKHEATVSPAVQDFVAKGSILPLSELPQHLDSFPKRWPIPRGDLYHWIPLLNRFDAILEQLIKEYGLDDGPQTKPFGTALLERGVATEGKGSEVKAITSAELSLMNVPSDGDRLIAEQIISFSRSLLENCGNRSLYASSERLSAILDTTSLSLLSANLQLMVRLAQRFHASRQRSNTGSQSMYNALLASHYNIDLEKIQKLAEPFSKIPSSYQNTNQTPPARKGKERASHNRKQSVRANANDLLSLLHSEPRLPNGSANSKTHKHTATPSSPTWDDWGDVCVIANRPAAKDDTKTSVPSTPSTSRRPSGPSRPSRLSTSESQSETTLSVSVEISDRKDEADTIKVTSNTLKDRSINDIMKDSASYPKEVRSDLLAQVRVAHSLMSSLESRQELVNIRLLALTNLAFIYTDENFKQKILQRDSDEPLHLQIIQQLCDLLRPPPSKPTDVPIKLQTTALGTLEALAKVKSKATDVCSALSINVNHGVLFYLLRNAIADMKTEYQGDVDIPCEEWRDAILALLDTLPTCAPRTGESLIGAGLLDLLVELLGIRTSKAERSFPKTITFLNNLVGPVRDAFQSLSTANGLESISNLMIYEVDVSLERAEKGEGLRPEYRNRVVDYQIPFFAQQTLRMIFKIVREMMTHNHGNFDRVLRNFMEQPALLAGLRKVIINPKVYGSSVWSGAVNIMSSFIHNEPTSYAIVAEAGLVRGFLETMSTKPLPAEGAATAAENENEPDPSIASDSGRLMEYFGQKLCLEPRPEGTTLARGVLPVTDAIIAIPHALGAICLNNTGMDLLRKTNALDNFFGLFESPTHLKAMTSEADLGQLIGSSLDELVRHHPTLKMMVLSSIIKMLTRVKDVCLEKGKQDKSGAKLWRQSPNGTLYSAGEDREPEVAVESDGDMVMSDASEEGTDLQNVLSSDNPLTPGQASDESQKDATEPHILTYINVAMKFLFGFCENTNICSALVEAGGADKVLELATLPVLRYDFNNHEAARELQKVMHLFTEAKPHLVLPTLVKQTQTFVDNLAPLHTHESEESFFADYTTLERPPFESSSSSSEVTNGTSIVQSLVSVHTLCAILNEIFSSPPFNNRATSTPFSQVNLADMYVSLLQGMTALNRVCVWEEILLMKRIPDSWIKATQVKGFGMGGAEADQVFNLATPSEGPSDSSPPSARRKSFAATDQKTAAFRNAQTLRFLLCQVPSAMVPFFQSLGKSLLGKRRSHASDPYQRQNASIVADAISSGYMQMLKYSSPHQASKVELHSYWIVVLTFLSRLMIDGSSERPHTQVLTLLLQSFRRDGGLNIIKTILSSFHAEVDLLSKPSGEAISKEDTQRLFSTYQGIQVILNLYKSILSPRSILDASQSEEMKKYENRSRFTNSFDSTQFLVELQITVLPVVKSLWDSDFVEKASSDIIKILIDIMKIILESPDDPDRTRGHHPESSKPAHKPYEISKEHIVHLMTKGYSEELAEEALYRCVNAKTPAQSYLQRLRHYSGALRLPIPAYDKPTRSATPSPGPRSEFGGSVTVEGNQDASSAQPTINEDTTAAAAGLAMLSQSDPFSSNPVPPHAAVEAIGEASVRASGSMPPPPAPGVPEESSNGPANDIDMEMSLDNLQSELPEVQSEDSADVEPEQLSNLIQRFNEARSGNSSNGQAEQASNLFQRIDEARSEFPSNGQAGQVPELFQRLDEATTLFESQRTESRSASHSQPPVPPSKMDMKDLNIARTEVRKTLIDRALDVLNVHDDVTFELSDLINAACSKATDAKAIRVEIGATLINSLISFDLDESNTDSGKQVAAYANLLALIIQNTDFFDACSVELKDKFEYMLGFVKISPNQTAGTTTTPWLGQTLLVMEKLLSEDSQPPQIKLSSPGPNGLPSAADIMGSEPPLVSREAKSDLFEALIKLMPSTGKDESIVLSIVRMLVILTRDREIASRLAEKKNIQRFFLMIKQLSGISDDRLTSSVMIVVRHMFEDDEIIRRIIRSEIRNGFESRPNRPMDVAGYIRHTSHLAIRSPRIFVEVSNEILEMGLHEPDEYKSIKLKAEAEKHVDADAIAEDSKPGEEKDKDTTAEDQLMQDKPSSTEMVQTANEKPKSNDKAPIVEHPSGVIHYLLSELLSYKDTDDSVGPQPKLVNGEAASASPAPQTPGSSSLQRNSSTDDAASDVDVPTTPPPPTTDTKKVEVKPDQHPIHTYRIFLLQCLTELLNSYNQAKIEFINFSRKAEAKATTPSKPRSAVLTYLLTEAIPLLTLITEDSVSYKKKDMTSTWAKSALVALCLRTNESGYRCKPGTIEEDDQPELVFVRKFVLEHSLKAFKDANSSDEDMDIKYGRMLDLADLFERLLSGTLLSRATFPANALDMGHQKPIAKLMFEKNFIATLTNSIADINLSLKGADRAVKYILRPLKLLTTAAVELSESSSISTTPGQTDEDEISSATSVSEVDDDREETPDLFRNSTLGMFESNREGGDSSDSSRSEDEEMYDDEDYDGMEYDDDRGGFDEQDAEEVISDEEEELQGMGPIEGRSGDAGMQVIIDEEEEDADIDDEDDDPDDSIDEDDELEMAQIQEDENDSLVGAEADDWRDEDDEGDEDGEDLDGDEDNSADDHGSGADIVGEFGGAEEALQRLDGLESLARDVENDTYLDDVVRVHDDDDEDEEAEDEDDDEGEDMDQTGLAYEPPELDEHVSMPDPPWGWGDPDDEPFHDHHQRHHHHHHYMPRHRDDPLPNPWAILGSGPGRSLGSFRSHRTPTTGPRDDGTNPLLQRQDDQSTPLGPRRSQFSTAMPSIGEMWMSEVPEFGAGLTTQSPVSVIHNILAAIGSADSGVTAIQGPGGQLQVRLPANMRSFEAIMGGHRPSPPVTKPCFVPQMTWQRWTDEAKMLFGPNEVQNRAQRVTNSLLRLMTPPALEKKKKREEEEQKRRKEAEEIREQEKKKREEELEAEKKKKKKEEEEAARAAEEAAAAEEQARLAREAEAAPQVEGEIGESGAHAEPMQGVVAESGGPAESVTAAAVDENVAPTSTEESGPSEPVERQIVDFNGTQLDITEMGIDMAYLDALPEDIRNEVLMTQLATQRAEGAAAGAPPTEIDNDFLQALPADIRAELLQQEAQERRRRERDEARRQRVSAEGTARAEDMDTGSFFASLDPNLRQHLLMEQDEETLAHLPADIAAEARALGGDRSMHRFAGGARIARPSNISRDIINRHNQHIKKQPRRPIVQMLDKPGVATLLRLMFMQQQSNVKQSLYGILQDIAMNKNNRAEIISLLLGLLQDGSVDVNAVERSYKQLSQRATQGTQAQPPRTPLKRTITDTSITSIASLSDLKITPLMVIQQCLGSLVFLTTRNPHIPSFFLNENDGLMIPKGKASKKSKGKEKETKALRYPINALLSLLDRPLITENTGCIEQLADLLQRITAPLMMLLKKEKEPSKEEKKDDKLVEEPATANAPEDTTSPTTPVQQTSPPLGDATEGPSTSPMADVQATTTIENQQSAEPSASTEGQGKQETKAENEKKDLPKPKSLTPPMIPEENLRLVVNIIVARECSSNTFKATLSTMTNLCAITGAKDIFGKRLVDAALDLGKSVHNDLNELIPQIKDVLSGNDPQGMDLTKFTPQSSDQAKLLRVLKALEFLFVTKRPSKPDGDDVSAKVDLVNSLYENTTFAEVWEKLGECMSAIRQGSGMLNVATILLPLVEALMVVCTNTTNKESALHQAARETSVASPPPEARMTSLFFRFTEEHRKIINDLVRQNPKLMSGTFQLLVKNPKVLEFDNKRNFFNRRLHQRNPDTRHPQPPLQLNVRRDQVFLDSFRHLSFKSGDEIKYGKLSIRFHGEEGVDAGGVTREWFQVLSRQMFNPDYALFIPVASDRTTFHPNKLSKVNEQHLPFFRFIGRIIGKALYEGRALDCHFSRAVYKRILGKTVSIKDMETLDLDYYKSLIWMLENDISDIITETLSIETDNFGVTEIVDLVPNGRNIPVTEENKQEYVQLVVEYRLTGSVKEQLEKFLEGFHDIVAPELISIFNEQELELLISGLPDIDIDDWKNHTEYHNYQVASPQIQWFWRAVRSFDKEERAKLLQFVTGTSKVPLNGFGQLEGMNGFSRFNIHRDYGNKERLPSSHTCFNQLDLPEYEDYESLRKQVYMAMTAGSEYFGFA